jgi:import receptor subunit TOM20
MTVESTLFWTTAACAVAGIGYAVYFDNKRRTDASFRRSLSMISLLLLKRPPSVPRAEFDRSEIDQRFNETLKKIVEQQRKEAEKLKAQWALNAPKRTAKGASSNYESFLEEEPLPTSSEDREKYFMKQLQTGEALLNEGPAAYEAAAVCFYRALKIFPDVSVSRFLRCKHLI